MLTVSRAKADQVARFMVGSLLLLPALLAYAFASWLPIVRTIALSLQTASLSRPGRFAGLANYQALLWRDSPFWPALGRSVLVAVVRLAAVTALPAAIYWAGRHTKRGRHLPARLALSLGMALSAPAALGLLWRLAASQVPWLGAWLAPEGAPTLASYLGLEFAAFLGVGGGLAAIALLLTSPGRAARRVLGLAALAAVASGLDAFSLPLALGGGARHEQTTLALLAFRTGFQQLDLGQAAAQAVPPLALSLALGFWFGLAWQRLALRPAQLTLAPPARGRALRLVAGALAGGLLLLPPLLLYLYGTGDAFLYPAAPLSRAVSVLEPEVSLFNGNVAPAVAIALIQLPTAYLAALSLTLVQPFGRRGSRLALAGLVAGGFAPAVVTGIGLFDVLHNLQLYNTLPAGGLSLIAGVAPLLVFSLYFAGQRARLLQAVRSGHRPADVFFRHSFRPSLSIGLLAGAASLLVAGQCFLWPLLVLARGELYPLSLRVLVQQMSLPGPQALGAAAWLALTCWALGILLFWWPLQAGMLERMELATEHDDVQ